jgi:DNA-binding transcriptional LysR family regulator
VLSFADEVLGALARLRRDLERERASRYHQHEVVTLACDPGPIKSLIPSLLAALHDRYPNVRVHLAHAGPDRINAMVMDGEADVGVQILCRVTSGLDAVPIWRDQMVLLAPPDHPAVTEPWRRATHIAESGFVLTTGGYARQVAEEWAASQGISLDVVLESQNLDMVKEAVIRGLGLTVLPELWLTNDLQEGRLSIVPVAGLPQEFQVCLITCAGQALVPAAHALLDVARDGRWRQQMPAWRQAAEGAVSS